MSDLLDLKKALRDLEDNNPESEEVLGLKAFISQIERLPPGATMMGRITPDMLSFAEKGKVRNAKTISDIHAAFGPEYQVSVE